MRCAKDAWISGARLRAGASAGGRNGKARSASHAAVSRKRVLFIEVDTERSWALGSVGPSFLGAWLRQHGHADASNGAMEFVPGSHLEGERAPADFIRRSGQPPIPGLAPMVPEGRARALPAVRAGELCFHHPLVWHRSGGNRADRPRRAWTATWLLPEVRWSPAHAPHPYNWE